MMLGMTYESPLQVVETPENRALIKEIAAEQGVSQAAVVRDLLRAGLAIKKGAAAVAQGAAEQVSEGAKAVREGQHLCLRQLSTSGAACSLPAGHPPPCQP